MKLPSLKLQGTQLDDQMYVRLGIGLSVQLRNQIYDQLYDRLRKG